jgi:hypothetical protein
LALTWANQLRTILAVISEPLSDRMCSGTPRTSMTEGRDDRVAKHDSAGFDRVGRITAKAFDCDAPIGFAGQLTVNEDTACDLSQDRL